MMGTLFVDNQNLLDPSQSKKWTISHALDPGLGLKSTKLITNSMAASFGSSDSTPLSTRLKSVFRHRISFYGRVRRVVPVRCHISPLSKNPPPRFWGSLRPMTMASDGSHRPLWLWYSQPECDSSLYL